MNLEEHFTSDELEYLRGLDGPRKFPWKRFLLALSPILLLIALGLFFFREMYLLGVDLDPERPFYILNLHLSEDKFPAFYKQYSGRIMTYLIYFRYWFLCGVLIMPLLPVFLFVTDPRFLQRKFIKCWQLLSQSEPDEGIRVEDHFSMRISSLVSTTVRFNISRTQLHRLAKSRT